MRNVKTLIEGLPYNDSVLNCYRNEIWLTFDDFSLILHYVCPENEEGVFPDTDFFELKDINTAALYVDEVCLSNGTSADEESYKDCSITYTVTMYAVVKQLQAKFPDAVEQCVVDTVFLDDGDFYGCPENCEYGYRIYLRPIFWENPTNLASLVSERLVTEFGFHSYYEGYIGKQFPDNYQFAFLGTNTKVRRLGYLNILLKLFADNYRIAKKSLPRQLEAKALETKEFLEAYKNKKGAITPSKTGVSAVPYIKLALELKVIREGNGFYELGKMGRVFLETKKIINDTSDSPFKLTTFEKVFWLERLLEQDYLYLSTLMVYALYNENPSYADLRGCFNQLITEKLEKVHSEAVMVPVQTKMALKAAIDRIKGWKKPDVYLEHVLMPRINWLYDLDLLKLEDDLSFKFTQEGKLLIVNILEWGDLSQKVICNPESYLYSFYMHVANAIFKNSEGDDSKMKNEALLDALIYGFDHFKTLAPNRVTYSVYAAFAKYTLLLNKNMLVEAADIRNEFLPSVADKYVFMFQRYYNDGFIQKK